MTDHLTTELLSDLAQREEQGTYSPSPEVFAQLSDKALRLLIGPTAIGKSTLMSTAAQHPGVAIARTIVSRSPRQDDDPDRYHYIPHTAEGINRFYQRMVNGELVQYAIHPTTGNIYASDISCYPEKINLFDVLATGVDTFRRLPSDTTTFKIVCPPEQWVKRLESRFAADQTKDLKKRLAEAALSLEWSLNDDESLWVINTDDSSDRAVQMILQPDQNQSLAYSKEAELIAADLLFKARELISGV